MMQRMWMTAASVAFFAAAAQGVTIDLVPVGNAGNLTDNTGYGAVPYVYQIGKYEVTNAQWREFLNAKASVGDPYGLYNTDMSGPYGGIRRIWSAGHYVYTASHGGASDNGPVNYVSFWDIARFCNWLHNGQGEGDTETGAYINIGDQSTFARQAGAQWWIPNEDEWYKAAYHKNDGVTGNYFDYPTGSDSEPSNELLNPDPGNNANFWDQDHGYTIGYDGNITAVGAFENSESPYGTFDQGGNVFEWNETVIAGSWRGVRGGDWSLVSNYMAASSFRSLDNDPSLDYAYVGFRVASIPEPSSISLLLCGATAGLMWWKRRR